jgi:phosphatidylglycerophosphatase C
MNVEECGNLNDMAVFDLDGTLVRGDTLLPFLMSFAWKRRRLLPVLGTPAALALWQCRLMSDQHTKETLLRWFCGSVPLDEIDSHARWFCQRWVQPRLKQSVTERLEYHRASGHRLILLSASPDIYVRQIGAHLGFPEVMCTRTRSEAGICTGRIEDSNCKGAEKLRLIQELCVRDGRPRTIFAYGDSRSDLPLLEWVESGFLVRGTQLTPVERRVRDTASVPCSN